MKQAQWLIRRYALSVLPSVQSLSALRKFAGVGVATKPFFGIGDPIFGNPFASPDNARGIKRAPPPLAAIYRCVSAWNKDPVSGVIGVQTGPH
jgi:hypothetical protein